MNLDAIRRRALDGTSTLDDVRQLLAEVDRLQRAAAVRYVREAWARARELGRRRDFRSMAERVAGMLLERGEVSGAELRAALDEERVETTSKRESWRLS